jgi:hypothetical protein
MTAKNYYLFYVELNKRIKLGEIADDRTELAKVVLREHCKFMEIYIDDELREEEEFEDDTDNDIDSAQYLEVWEVYRNRIRVIMSLDGTSLQIMRELESKVV